MSQPGISVVMCTYNGEAFLKEQLDSILAQSLLPSEIIISDDGSTDNTVDILKYYEANPLFHIYYQSSNLGPVKNFDFAASRANCEWVAFCDQDDIWHPNKLEVLAAQFDTPLIYADSELVNEEGRSLGKKLSGLRNLYSGSDSRGFIFSNVVWGHAMIVKQGLLKAALPVPGEIPHDIWLAFKATTLGGIKYVDQPLVFYRQHSKTVTTTIAQPVSQRTGDKRYSDYEKQLRWIRLMYEHERPSYKSFYNKLLIQYQKKAGGNYVWSLLVFLIKHRQVLFQFSRKNWLSQLIEIIKQGRGEHKSIEI